MSWTIRTIGRISKGVAAIFPSQPFEERLLRLSWKRLTSLASRPRNRTSVRPRARDLRILESCSASGPHLSSCFRSLGRSPTVTLRAFHHFECTDPSFSTRPGDFRYERFIGSNGRIPEAGSQLAIIIGRSVSLVSSIIRPRPTAQLIAASPRDIGRILRHNDRRWCPCLQR